MSTKFLDYELALLLAKYGRKAVLNVLSQKLKLSQEELETALHELDNRDNLSRRSEKRHDLRAAVEALTAQYPEKAARLKLLVNRFQSKSFLPELRDVRRFFEQHSQNLGRVKSRIESSPKLIRLLADLDVSELDALCQDSQSPEYSSLGIISDEILKRDKCRTTG